ncbi:mechanosensitive ion channel domain-containing protein [Pelagicoccus sp. SDUM812003]|uniref:mechanosensitive ion channel family protein n=1 Tax=Pelagicoccus sp. SDUM812003 TaxID=3041267 RepID=UPI0028104A32|nr:mechanosensitive ion channel domain-containing protein [Pelagicoccus sp. SDUM812003]MDQ8205537.1 mechanosensitive ion channel [Pelagicoccus sp. SDUM812003]
MKEFLSKIDGQAVLQGAITTVIILVGAMLIWLLISRGLQLLERRPKVSKTLILPIRLALRYALFLMAVLLILTSFGIPIGNFWTFVSTLLGLIAIGFVAVWSVLSNISATFFLLLVQPFRVGNFVKVVGDDIMGEVIDINFMFTTIRSTEGDVFNVPNNQFFQKATLRPADPKAYMKKLEAKEDEA